MSETPRNPSEEFDRLLTEASRDFPGEDQSGESEPESDHQSTWLPDPETANPKKDCSETQIEELMDQWEASHEAGTPIAVDTLCSCHPEMVEEVRRRIAALKSVDRKLRKRSKDRSGLEPLQIEATIDSLKFVNAGGLGEVFRGEDSKLHRNVAIKFMHGRLCADEESRNRFALEAEVTGRLEHPGVVPLYGFGCTDDNRLFYAMRFIDGETLDDAIESYFRKVDHLDAETSESEMGVDCRRLLTNFVSVCKTIAYAHNRGIVHRDIKPANVMLGRFGETIVVDWGLAVPVLRDERFKISGEKTLMPSASGSNTGSTSGRGAGTPAFMSPEQASELAPTPASDIYSLGATLFKILCGKPPISSKSLPEIRANLIDGKLPVLSEIRSDIPKPLQAICMKAMALHPTNRYPTALDLARDVERYLADEPVEVYSDSLGQRLMRFSRRHRAAAQVTLAALCLGLLISMFAALAQTRSANIAWQAEVDANIAKDQIQRAKDAADVLRNRNLGMSSQFMAKSIGQEIDRIWRVLEYEANSPDLRSAVLDLNQNPINDPAELPEAQTQLQQWLERRCVANDNVMDALFVLSAGGTQLARAPLPKSSQVGTNFSYRDYYTGIGRDLEDGEEYSHTQPLIGKDVHMSAAYMSTLRSERVLKVTFTVPIWDDFPGRRGRKIGVLGTSANIGALIDKNDYSHAWLVDMRENSLLQNKNDESSSELRGLLLQHPQLAAQSGSENYPRLRPEDVEALAPMMEDDFGEWTDYEIMDPFSSLKSHASITPITIDGRGRRPQRTGWLVVAVERVVE